MSPKVAILAVQCSLGCMTVMLTAKVSHAQWVNVTQGGGVHVRAPFVRVDVDPYGGVSVRAPFTRVDIPGRHYYPAETPVLVEPRIVRPSPPTARELAAMDDEALRQTLRLNAARLHESLGRFNTGATWQRYLRLPEKAIADASSERHSRHEALTRTRERFRYVMTDPQYAMIARLPSFAATQAVLTEMISRIDIPAAEELPMPKAD